MLRDIRDHLPKTAQTDANKFPQYEYRPYPRMMKDENGKPHLGPSGNPVVVNSQAEEDEFRGTQEKPTAAKTVSIDPSSDGGTTLQALVAASDADDDTPAKRGPGRPPKLPADLKA